MIPTEPAEIDPRVSCPIVAGDYMRATGFFFETDHTYLITARHNVLPTYGSKLETGDFDMQFEMPDMFYKIDVYLRSDDAFTVETLHLPDLPCMVVDPRVDVIAVQVPFDPETYGYTVFGPEDIPDTQSDTQSFDTIGFPGQSFPAPGEYDTEMYAEKISVPHILPTIGPVPPEALQLTNIQNIAVSRVTGDIGTDNHYRGLSGSPVLGDGLVGIHTLNHSIQVMNTETGQQTDGMLTAYWQSGTLLHLLEEARVGEDRDSENSVGSGLNPVRRALK